MRISLLTCLVLAPGLAWSDTCLDDIHALFDGPLDPFQRPAHSQRTMVFDATGAQTREMLSIVETPLRTIAGDPSANWFTMAIDQDVWNGTSFDGPWTNTGAQMPADRADAMKRMHEDQKNNVSDATCHGENASGHMVYAYRTQTTPDATGSFFGYHDKVTLDPDIGQIVGFERTDFVNPWTEGVSKERWLITVTFDPSIKISPPQ